MINVEKWTLGVNEFSIFHRTIVKSIHTTPAPSMGRCVSWWLSQVISEYACSAAFFLCETNSNLNFLSGLARWMHAEASSFLFLAFEILSGLSGTSGLKAQGLETEIHRKRLRPFISPDVAAKKLWEIRFSKDIHL